MWPLVSLYLPIFPQMSSGLLPTRPKVDLEWDWKLKLPSADDVCDGKLWIWTWLHVTSTRQLDSTTFWHIDRKILPQKFEVTWELDTDAGNEVDYCPTRSNTQAGGSNLDIGGYTFNHRAWAMDPDPPNTDGEAVQATNKYRWESSLVSVASNPITALGGLNLLGGASAGVNQETHSLDLHWIVTCNTKEVYREPPPEGEDPRYIEIKKPELAETIYAFVEARGPNRGALKKGEGEGVYTAEYVKNDTIGNT